jgi:phosphatidylethanolamine-binding protein (PEBP) family uncharacterized protein
LLYNLPPSAFSLEAGMPTDASLPGGGLNGKNGATKDELLKAMEGHILGQAELVGTYSR